MDFPYFDGEDPMDWLKKSFYYFDMYQVSDVYKSRMAVLNFYREVHAWYHSFKVGAHPLPWFSRGSLCSVQE
jgi:hypothetical protein